MESVRVPLLAATLALGGALSAAAYVHLKATAALDLSLDERLSGIGVALGSRGATLDQAALKEVMTATALEAAYVVNRDRRIVASAVGEAGRPVDLLRVDPVQLERAFAGSGLVRDQYAFGVAEVVTAYFPIRGPGGSVDRVLVLEAGKAFGEVRRRSSRALLVAFALALIGAAALAVLSARWVRSEKVKREALARAAQADALRVVAAAAAHEIRNPLGVIRATIDLMRERLGQSLQPKDSSALSDIVEEVQRLRQLTDDLVELSAERPLSLSTVEVTPLLLDLGAFVRTRSEAVQLETKNDVVELRADPLRLRQILQNLVGNAIDAEARRIVVSVTRAPNGVRMAVEDDGRGVPQGLRERLFDPFATGKSTGTGLGLALSRRFAERHGGSLAFVPVAPGARFELFLPQ